MNDQTEKTPLLGTDKVTQIGFLVHDIEKSARIFADFLGVEMPVIKMTGPIETAQTQYRGNPSKARAKLAFFPVGEHLDIELIEPDNEPSTWRDDLDRKGEGFHHIAFVVKNMAAQKKKLEESGLPVLQTGEYKNGRYAYIDATNQLKAVIELLEND